MYVRMYVSFDSIRHQRLQNIFFHISKNMWTKAPTTGSLVAFTEPETYPRMTLYSNIVKQLYSI